MPSSRAREAEAARRERGMEGVVFAIDDEEESEGEEEKERRAKSRAEEEEENEGDMGTEGDALVGGRRG